MSSSDPIGDLERELVAGWRRAHAPGARRLRWRPVLAVVVPVACVVLAVAGVLGGTPRELALDPQAAATPLTAWPLRGDAAGDRSALRAARDAWTPTARIRPLAAQAVGPQVVVVLTGVRGGERRVATVLVAGPRARVVDDRPASRVDPAGFAVLVPEPERRLLVAVAAPGGEVRGLESTAFDAAPDPGPVVATAVSNGATAANVRVRLDPGGAVVPGWATTAPPPLAVGEGRAFYVPSRFALLNPDGPPRGRRFADADGRTLRLRETLGGRLDPEDLVGGGDVEATEPHGAAPMVVGRSGDRTTFAWTARRGSLGYTVVATGDDSDAVARQVADALTTAGPDAPRRRPPSPTPARLRDLRVDGRVVSGRLVSSPGCRWDRNVQVLVPAGRGGFEQLGHDRSDRAGRFEATLRRAPGTALAVSVNPRSFNPDGAEEFCVATTFRR